MRARPRFLTALLLLLVTTLAVVHPIFPVQAIRDRKTLSPVADAEVRSAQPDVNLGRIWGLSVERNSEETVNYLMFDLGQLPAGTTAIEEAALRLYAAEGTATSTGEVNVHYCPSNDWTEDGITYNKPAFQSETIDSVNVTSNSIWYEWNVTSTATSTLRTADKRLSVALEGSTNGGIIVFYSRQSPGVDLRPQLSVLYSYTPSSGKEPVLVALIVIVVAAASAIGLVAYTRRKKRK